MMNINICHLSNQGFYLEHRNIPSNHPIPHGWIVADPPSEPGYHKWFAGQWVEFDQIDREPVPPLYQAKQISRIDFSRLFTGMQQARINALRKICSTLTPDDYVDPAQGLFVQLEIVFQQFDLPLEFIELNHEDTRLGLELLGYAGVFGDDAEVTASEINRIIAGELPA